MINETILDELDIEKGEFRYFEQLAALMETTEVPDYDTFAEIMHMADREAMKEMLSAFFTDMLSGVPDDDTELYKAIQEVREPLIALSSTDDERAFRFLTDELYYLREWYNEDGTVVCTPENGDEPRRVSPLEAFMLFRAEKLSMEKYYYDFTEHMPESPGEHVLELIDDMGLLTYDGEELDEYIVSDDASDDLNLVDSYDPVIDGEWED